MRKFFAAHRQKTGIACFVVGILLSVAACGVLVLHTRIFSLKRDTAVMTGTTLPALRSAVNLLEANVQAEELFAESALDSREEIAEVKILPNSSLGSAFAASLTDIAAALSSSAHPLAITRLTFDPTTKPHDGYVSLGAHLTLSGDASAVSRLLGITGFAGSMMVRDVLPPDKLTQFLAAVEETAPLKLREAETLLYTDVLTYALDPDGTEGRFFSSLSDIPASNLKAILLQSGVAELRTAFSGVGSLRSSRAWPMPLSRIDTLSRDGNAWNIELTVYGR